MKILCGFAFPVLFILAWRRAILSPELGVVCIIFYFVTNFYVLLTVHPNIMIVFFYQLDTQILYFSTFIIFLYVFRALLCSSSGGQLYWYSIWYRHSLWVTIPGAALIQLPS